MCDRSAGDSGSVTPAAGPGDARDRPPSGHRGRASEPPPEQS
ncbi:hypothetical protein F750_4350 [Streptomyces sp. PAMC 26508]|nr:hypothetical protein F750_4350 [Streptomyces sp. PAMC 26508]